MKYHSKHILALVLAATAGLHGRNGQLGVVVVDIQADFVALPVKDPRTLQTLSEQGSLAVDTAGTPQQAAERAKKYINAAEKATETFRSYRLPIFFTQDWHPAGHVSFASTWGQPAFTSFEIKNQQGYRDQTQKLWPDHCVQGSAGARILLKMQPQDIVIQKGTNLYEDSYSGFEDAGGTKTPLADELHKKGITDLIVYGIATDICVHDTMKDGLNAGFAVHFIINLSRGVDFPAATMLPKIAKLQQDKGLLVYYIKDANDGTKVSDYKKKGLNIIVCENIADFMNKVHQNIRSGDLEYLKRFQAAGLPISGIELSEAEEAEWSKKAASEEELKKKQQARDEEFKQLDQTSEQAQRTDYGQPHEERTYIRKQKAKVLSEFEKKAAKDYSEQDAEAKFRSSGHQQGKKDFSKMSREEIEKELTSSPGQEQGQQKPEKVYSEAEIAELQERLRELGLSNQ